MWLPFTGDETKKGQKELSRVMRMLMRWFESHSFVHYQNSQNGTLKKKKKKKKNGTLKIDAFYFM